MLPPFLDVEEKATHRYVMLNYLRNDRRPLLDEQGGLAYWSEPRNDGDPNFAQSEAESQYHPARFKTQLCDSKKCKFANVPHLCPFAHGEVDLRKEELAGSYTYENCSTSCTVDATDGRDTTETTKATCSPSFSGLVFRFPLHDSEPVEDVVEKERQTSTIAGPPASTGIMQPLLWTTRSDGQLATVPFPQHHDSSSLCSRPFSMGMGHFLQHREQVPNAACSSIDAKMTVSDSASAKLGKDSTSKVEADHASTTTASSTQPKVAKKSRKRRATEKKTKLAEAGQGTTPAHASDLHSVSKARLESTVTKAKEANKLKQDAGAPSNINAQSQGQSKQQNKVVVVASKTKNMISSTSSGSAATIGKANHTSSSSSSTSTSFSGSTSSYVRYQNNAHQQDGRAVGADRNQRPFMSKEYSYSRYAQNPYSHSNNRGPSSLQQTNTTLAMFLPAALASSATSSGKAAEGPTSEGAVVPGQSATATSTSVSSRQQGVGSYEGRGAAAARNSSCAAGREKSRSYQGEGKRTHRSCSYDNKTATSSNSARVNDRRGNFFNGRCTSREAGDNRPQVLQGRSKSVKEKNAHSSTSTASGVIEVRSASSSRGPRKQGTSRSKSFADYVHPGDIIDNEMNSEDTASGSMTKRQSSSSRSASCTSSSTSFIANEGDRGQKEMNHRKEIGHLLSRGWTNGGWGTRYQQHCQRGNEGRYNNNTPSRRNSRYMNQHHDQDGNADHGDHSYRGEDQEFSCMGPPWWQADRERAFFSGGEDNVTSSMHAQIDSGGSSSSGRQAQGGQRTRNNDYHHQRGRGRHGRHKDHYHNNRNRSFLKYNSDNNSVYAAGGAGGDYIVNNADHLQRIDEDRSLLVDAHDPAEYINPENLQNGGNDDVAAPGAAADNHLLERTSTNGSAPLEDFELFDPYGNRLASDTLFQLPDGRMGAYCHADGFCYSIEDVIEHSRIICCGGNGCAAGNSSDCVNNYNGSWGWNGQGQQTRNDWCGAMGDANRNSSRRGGWRHHGGGSRQNNRYSSPSNGGDVAHGSQFNLNYNNDYNKNNSSSCLTGCFDLSSTGSMMSTHDNVHFCASPMMQMPSAQSNSSLVQQGTSSLVVQDNGDVNQQPLQVSSTSGETLQPLCTSGNAENVLVGDSSANSHPSSSCAPENGSSADGDMTPPPPPPPIDLLPGGATEMTFWPASSNGSSVPFSANCNDMMGAPPGRILPRSCPFPATQMQQQTTSSSSFFCPTQMNPQDMLTMPSMCNIGSQQGGQSQLIDGQSLLSQLQQPQLATSGEAGGQFPFPQQDSTSQFGTTGASILRVHSVVSVGFQGMSSTACCTKSRSRVTGTCSFDGSSSLCGGFRSGSGRSSKRSASSGRRVLSHGDKTRTSAACVSKQSSTDCRADDRRQTTLVVWPLPADSDRDSWAELLAEYKDVPQKYDFIHVAPFAVPTTTTAPWTRRLIRVKPSQNEATELGGFVNFQKSDDAEDFMDAILRKTAMNCTWAKPQGIAANFYSLMASAAATANRNETTDTTNSRVPLWIFHAENASATERIENYLAQNVLLNLVEGRDYEIQRNKTEEYGASSPPASTTTSVGQNEVSEKETPILGNQGADHTPESREEAHQVGPQEEKSAGKGNGEEKQAVTIVDIDAPPQSKAALDAHENSPTEEKTPVEEARAVIPAPVVDEAALMNHDKEGTPTPAVEDGDAVLPLGQLQTRESPRPRKVERHKSGLSTVAPLSEPSSSGSSRESPDDEDTQNDGLCLPRPDRGQLLLAGSSSATLAMGPCSSKEAPSCCTRPANFEDLPTVSVSSPRQQVQVGRALGSGAPSYVFPTYNTSQQGSCSYDQICGQEFNGRASNGAYNPLPQQQQVLVPTQQQLLPSACSQEVAVTSSAFVLQEQQLCASSPVGSLEGNVLPQVPQQVGDEKAQQVEKKQEQKPKDDHLQLPTTSTKDHVALLPELQQDHLAEAPTERTDSCGEQGMLRTVSEIVLPSWWVLSREQHPTSCQDDIQKDERRRARSTTS
ncbi:unnamed protein product [Amoebophrya sp. A25]|nr:unnamed protein product [Amoebophrya sp. A25]|eukprot:GSA25T00006747001.1